MFSTNIMQPCNVPCLEIVAYSSKLHNQLNLLKMTYLIFPAIFDSKVSMFIKHNIDTDPITNEMLMRKIHILGLGVIAHHFNSSLHPRSVLYGIRSLMNGHG